VVNRSISQKKPTLEIAHEERKVATLSYDLSNDSYLLQYADDWKEDGFPLSPHLPLQGEVPTDNVKKFLENLLPEEGGLKKLARALHIERSNIYALISALGQDATGAFAFRSGSENIKTVFREISIEELTKRVCERSVKPISMWDGKPRLSLAGVQEKLGITLRNGVYGLGDGRISSTHILKFGSREQNLVLNEYFCMKLAEAAGIPVARVELRQFGERVLEVERFDRAWAAKDHVVRRHIIDGCQALNAPPAFKYQRIVPVGPDRDSFMGPVNVESLAGFCDLCIVPAKARLQTLRWILFNLLIGNSDSHGKNISYFVSSKGYEVAPAYDLVSVAMYEDFHQELAFEIGDTFDLDQVKAYQLAEMGKAMRLEPRFIGSQLRKLCMVVNKQIETIKIADLAKAEGIFIEKLVLSIQKRVRTFAKYSNQLK
jgi:serine/threonine-protein kinase HipA